MEGMVTVSPHLMELCLITSLVRRLNLGSCGSPAGAVGQKGTDGVSCPAALALERADGWAPPEDFQEASSLPW